MVQFLKMCLCSYWWCRVNLIGEHIDYCGYGVLPMAVDEEVIVAVGPTQSGMLELSNVDSDYEDFVCSLEGITIDNATPDWYKYFLCGVKGIAEHSAAADAIPLPGFRAMVHGSVPPCSGLSSSSALVCSAALATAHFNLVSLTRQQLADTCAKSECFIGTEGGGMDQAIAILATKGTLTQPPCQTHLSLMSTAPRFGQVHPVQPAESQWHQTTSGGCVRRGQQPGWIQQSCRLRLQLQSHRVPLSSQSKNAPTIKQQPKHYQSTITKEWLQK